jgi:hypothetical protein
MSGDVEQDYFSDSIAEDIIPTCRGSPAPRLGAQLDLHLQGCADPAERIAAELGFATFSTAAFAGRAPPCASPRSRRQPHHASCG